MKLNSFGETIRRVEAERKAEAQAAIDAGWTEADHPEKCCPHLAVATPQPKRAGRSLEELERLHAKAGGKAKWWTDEHLKRQAAAANHDASAPKFDHGMMQLSLSYRQKGMNRGFKLWKEVELAKERAGHFTRLTLKYQDQIQKRTP